MIETIADIEALIQSCRSTQSKDYISEAVLCYRSGAYRATIVCIWIALVYDLIDKIKELSLFGELKAKELEIKYERYLEQIEQGNDNAIKCALEFERNILKISKNDLLLIDNHQYTDLLRLQEDRHRCAHPSFRKSGVPYHPSAEQARMHLRNAVIYVLSQPPLQGKTAVAELIRIVSSKYFPIDEENALLELKKSSLLRASDSLVRGFIDKLIYEFIDSSSELFKKKRVITVINCTRTLYPTQVEERFKTKLNKLIVEVEDIKFQYVASFTALLPFAWNILDHTSKNRIAEFIKKGPYEEVSVFFKYYISINELKQITIDRINNSTVEELNKILNIDILKDIVKERSLVLLSNCHRWKQVNNVIDNLIFPTIENYNKEDFKRIIEMTTNDGTDLPYAAGFNKLIEFVKSRIFFTNEELNDLLIKNKSGYLIATEQIDEKDLPF